MISFSVTPIFTATAALSLCTVQLSLILLRLFESIVLNLVSSRVRLLSQENTDIKGSHIIYLTVRL